MRAFFSGLLGFFTGILSQVAAVLLAAVLVNTFEIGSDVYLAFLLTLAVLLSIATCFLVVRSLNIRRWPAVGIGTSLSILLTLSAGILSFQYKLSIDEPLFSTDEIELILKDSLPHFPWPAPKPSAFAVLPDEYFNNGPLNLYEVGTRISVALDALGYSEHAYFYVPSGLAIVTRLEQIRDDGSPLPEPDRWNPGLIAGMHEFSLSEYLRVLFKAPIGRYRIIVFVVSSLVMVLSP